MLIRLARTCGLFVSSLAYLKGLLCLAWVMSVSSCALQAEPPNQPPTATNTLVLETEEMNGHSGTQIPHGLADPDGKFAYVVGPQGLIYQLELESGESPSRTTFPGYPLAVQGETLIVTHHDAGAPNNVRLLAVAPQGGTLQPVWEQTIELPDWVEVGSPEAGRFNLQTEIQDEEVIIGWQASSRYSGGAPPPAGVEAAESRQASQAVYLDVRTGAVLREEQRGSVPFTGTPLPALPANRSIVPYLQGGSWATQPWSVNAGDAYLVRSSGDSEILLVRREPGNARSPVEIHLSDDPGAVIMLTPDGKFIFVHEARNDPATWLVYSVMDGKLLARMPFDPGTQAVSVVGEQVLYLVVKELGGTRSSTLHSRELQSGQKMWSFTLGSEAITAAPPPQP